MTVEEKKAEEGSYDPFEHRVVEKPNSDVRSTANLIKASMGSGVLAVPLAYANSGYALGVVGTLIVGFICGHCIHILVSTSRGCCKLDRKPQLGYADTCQSVFNNGPKSIRKYANTARTIADMSLFLTHVGICCVYTILIADSVKQLVDEFFPQHIIKVEFYCLMLLVPLLCLTQIKHLKYLANLSLLANILLVTTFAICLYYVFSAPISFEGRKPVNDLSRLPAFLSTIIFAMEGVGVVMPIENSMKQPAHFLGCPSVLVAAMGFIVTIMTILGLFGYMRFGDALRGSITLTLPVDEWPAICAKSCISLSIFLTFPLQYYVVVDTYRRYCAPHIRDSRREKVEIVARVVGVLVCVCIGMALPMLEQILNLVGAFFYSILGLIIPCIIHTIFQIEDLGRFKWILWKNVIIIVFGLTCLVSGCTVAINDIIHILNSKTE